MELKFDKSFLKSLDKITDTQLKSKIRAVIQQVEKAETQSDIKQCKKLKGHRYYYRIKIGDYRIGVEIEQTNTVNFILVTHRKEIYRRFP